MRSPGTWILLLAGCLNFGLPSSGRGADAELETPFLRFRLSGTDGRYEMCDKLAGVTWRSNPYTPRFGEAAVRRGTGGRMVARLGECAVRSDGEALVARFGEAGVTVGVRVGRDRRALEFRWVADPGVTVEWVRLLDDALWVTDRGPGAVLVPVRLGLRVPADSGLAFTHRFDTYAYEGCHMAMFGLLQGGAALLVTWDDPYTALDVRSTLTNVAGVHAGQILSPSLTLRESGRSFRVRVLGRGDEQTVARAYRDEARAKGWWVPWDRKLREHPEAERLFGASNYKLWSMLDRQMNEESSREEKVTVNWTFEEAGAVAEHLKRDLRLDRVLFILGGWIHRGYDNQHPDILPTAPECGGDPAFAACARRVRQQGYVLGLHDNYQDIYRDSPSWDERWIMKQRDGALAKGGHWAGGVAYLTCSSQALALARRPQNLPAVYQLSGPAAYFIDTTYAAGLQECFDPAHPLTRLDDLHWKQEISDYARGLFGLFGSECGREWAIPHADFFEGLTGVSGAGFHDAKLPGKLGAVVYPLFEMVYRETIALYGKYGYDIYQSSDYVLHHVSIGRPLHYHAVPPHLYWQRPLAEVEPLPLRALAPQVETVDGRRFTVRYAWDVQQPLSGDWRVFVHFTDHNGRILFQNDYSPAEPPSAWATGRRADGPFPLTVPDTVTGKVDVRVGLFRLADGARAKLLGRDDGESRYRVGRLTVAASGLTFEPGAAQGLPALGDPGRFTRGERGGAAGLHPFDRFVKNTHEILSPLHELTARIPLVRHEFLTPDRRARRTVFGEGREAIEVVVNPGDAELRCRTRWGAEVVLPPDGFLVEGKTLAAFCARRWNGVDYAEPALFVVRALDGRRLDRSRAVRVFHGFGEPTLRLGTRELTVAQEQVLDPHAP